MGFSPSALLRASGIRRARGITSAAAAPSGAYVSVADLVALEHAARGFGFLRRQPVHSLLAGRHGSKVRGRGLSFEELRRYVPGDDVRAMDWRVTARTGKPYVRVFSEEKDRSALLVVDQRTSMFFGTRRVMKSVTAAEAAALVAWRALAQGDRVGGLVLGDADLDEARPQRSRAAVVGLLERVAARNAALRADAPFCEAAAAQLDRALDAASRLARHDALVVVVSDFAGHGERTRTLLAGLAQHNDVLAVLVYDPFLLELPDAGDLVVSDGRLQVEIGFAKGSVRESIAAFARGYGQEILAWERIGVPVLPVSAAEETAPQLRRLLGQVAARRRRR